MAAFTVISDTDECVITLTYTDGKGGCLRFEPERQEYMWADAGMYSFPTSNGCCSLLWNDDVFDFELSKHGDGNGGMLLFTVPATLELKTSFHDAITKWNEAVQKIKANQKAVDSSS